MKVKKGDSSDAVIDIGPCDGNATPAVVAASSRLRDGGTLRFAPGEYHFFEEGAKDLFLASPGSSTGPKKVAIHIEGRKDVTIDGGGARFVFHGQTFPIVAQRCDGLAIRNFTSRVFQPAIAEFTILEKGDDGFLCQFAPDSPPYETTDDGTILFDTDEGSLVSLTADTMFLVDTKGRIEIAGCESSWSLDDAINIHGNYTALDSVDGRHATLKIQHHAYAGYFPYRVGEKVEFSRGHGTGKAILGRAAVAEFPAPGRDTTSAQIVFDFHVPFTGRAVVEGNRLSGPGSDNPLTLGPGVEVARGAEDAPTASGRATSRAPAPPSLPQPCKEDKGR